MGDVSMAEKPTIVLVHGAWHTADCWSLVTSQLKEYGYPFKAVQLPSSGGGLTVTVEEDAAHIRKTTSQLVESGKDVILAVHSYGGIPGTDSAKGLLKKERLAEQKSGGIISIVYITAFLVPVGATLGGFIGGMAPWVKIDGERLTVEGAEEIFYNGVSNSSMNELVSNLKHQAKTSFYTPLTYAAYQDTPVSYLLCEQDNAIPFEAQKAMVGIGGPNVVSHVCSSGHSPMLTMPEKVVDVIREAAGEIQVSA